MAFSQIYPFEDGQQLSPIQIKVQKFKMTRLRIIDDKNKWYIVRGINEEISDETLLSFVNQTDRLKKLEGKRFIGDSIAISGILIMGGGGILVSDVLKIENGLWYGIGLLVVGGVAAIVGEVFAGNMGSNKYNHSINRQEAEIYVKEFNEELKKKLGIEDLEIL